MPDRATIPVFIAVAAGFIAGTIAAISELYGATALTLAIIVGIGVFASGVVSVIKTPGEESERRIVGILRGLVAVASFGFLFAGIFFALRDGNFLGLLSIAVGGFFALLLTRFRVRDHGELEPTS